NSIAIWPRRALLSLLIEPMMAQFSPCPQGALDANCDVAAPQSSRGGRWQPRLRRAAACIAQERKQQPAHFAGLFLLHPMSGAIDEVAADHVRAGLGLHRLEHAGALIGAPVLLAGDEGRGNIDGAARPRLQFRREHTHRAAAIPLQAALESVA